MKTKLTLLLCLLNVIIFYLIYHLDQNHNPDQSKTQLSILDAHANNIHRIEIDNKTTGQFRIIEQINNSWNITNPISWPANIFAIQQIISQLHALEPEVSFSVEELLVSGQTLKDYGLEDPQLTINLYTSDEKISILVGSSTNLGNRVYIMVPKFKNEVLVVQRSIIEVLSMNLDELRSHDLFHIPYYELDALSIQLFTPQNIKIRLSQKSDLWQFDAPIQTTANSYAVNDIISALTTLEIQKFILEQNQTTEHYGLTNPTMKVSIQGNTNKETLLLGNLDPEAPNNHTFFAKLDDNPTIFTVSSTVFSKLKNAQETLREKHFLYFEKDNIKDITISQSNHNIQLQKRETGSWEIRDKNTESKAKSIDADDSIIQEMLTSLSALEASEFVSDAPSASDLNEYGLSDPQRTIVLTGDNSTSLLVGNIDKKSGNLYAKINHSPYIYKIDPSILALCPISELHFKNRTLQQLPKGSRIESLIIKNTSSNKVIFEGNIGQNNNSLEATLHPSTNKKDKYVASILKNLRELNVNSYLNNSFSNVVSLDNETQLPWDISIEMSVIYPGNSSLQKENINLFFTKRLTGGFQIGGSPLHHVTFSLTQDMIDSLFPLTHESMSDTSPN